MYDSEMKLAESIANEIRDRIQTHYMESGISSGYEKAEVLVPMTENINMPFEIDVPYEMTDEDNTALLEYFIQHIYKPENGSYMTEAVNTLIAEKEMDLQALQENLDNFDAEAFMRGDYDPFNENDSPIVELPNMAQEKYTVVKLEDILDTPIDDDNNILLFEMAGQIPGEAKIPGKPKKPGLIIAMGARERNIHHFHVYRTENDLEEWANGACLYLDANKYYDHGKNQETLTEDELLAVIEKLKERYPNERFHGTNWEFLVELWNANNHRYPVDPNLEMPPYDYKTITRYKEE